MPTLKNNNTSQRVDSLKPYRFPWHRLFMGILLLTVVIAFATSQGSVGIPFVTVAKMAIGSLPGIHITETWPSTWQTIIWDIRLPRVISAAIVGAALAISGGAYQGLFRNPLADPYLVGSAAGAGLGATIVLVTPVPMYYHGLSLLAIFAFIGALGSVMAAYMLSRVGGLAQTTTLILAGVAIAAMTGAMSAFLLMSSSQDPRPVLAWLLGGFGSSSWQSLGLALPYIVVGAIITMLHGRILNALQLDEDQASYLGIDVERAKAIVIATASLMTAAAVSISGLIGFVGLITPHVVRLLWGPDYRSILPISLIIGSAFLVLADLAARVILPTGELPVGIVTAFVGAPFFLFILRHKGQTWT